jgi:hypothetical protein
MLIPMRGGEEGLVVTWDLAELYGALPRPNVDFERVWAGVLTVVRDSWPDWPVEVWAQVVETTPDEDDVAVDRGAPTYALSYAVFFGGEGRESKTAAAMAAFVLSALGKSLPLTPTSSWGQVDPDWKPLWVIDDAEVIRMLAPEATLEPSVYMLGSYAGIPTLFAASVEAWPLKPNRGAIGVELAEADVAWAFT